MESGAQRTHGSNHILVTENSLFQLMDLILIL